MSRKYVKITIWRGTQVVRGLSAKQQCGGSNPPRALIKMKIANHQKLADNYYKLTIESEKISSTAKPGQFINVRINPGTCPLLRRPFAIHKVNKNNGTFEILFEVVGTGTKCLSMRKTGEELDILGPLGNGFNIDNKKNKAILVAGGIGVAPLTFLAKELIQKGKEVYMIVGAKTDCVLLCDDQLLSDGCKIKSCTEDGTAGQKGLVTDLLTPIDLQLTDIYTCGPKSMMKEVAKIAKQKKVNCQVSLEEKMACGIGACLGCSILTRKGMKMVCKDGPVFNAEDIIW